MQEKVNNQKSHNGLSSPEAIVRSSLLVGAQTGLASLFISSFVGIWRSSQPAVFAVAAGIRWFGFGSSFWATRQIVLKAPSADEDRRAGASGIAGAIAGGTVAALTRTRALVVPHTLVFGCLGFAAQQLYDIMDRSHTARVQETQKGTFFERLASSKWLPVKPLTDKEYEHLMKEKLIRVEAEIAIVEDDIKALKSQCDVQSHVTSRS